MGRLFESKPAHKRGDIARPGAARTLPLQLMAQVPVIRRLAPSRETPQPPPARRLSPRRVLQLLRRRPPKAPAPPAGFAAIPFVSPVIRRVRRPIERTAAPALHAALSACANDIRSGKKISQAMTAARHAIRRAGFVIDYVEARHAATLAPIHQQKDGPIRLLVAARIGTTRLIDNIPV